jgi:pimeloyl-ACP methyl ester carboxylesterase
VPLWSTGTFVHVVSAVTKVIGTVGLVCLATSSVLAASGCARQNDAASENRNVASGQNFGGSGAGSLNSAEDFWNIDTGLAAVTSLAQRITYTSTSGINDSDYKVTGAVFVPKGEPPAGGWPLVAFGHPATGVLRECAPSSSPRLLGQAATVTELVKAGYVVVVPDYLGLGSSSPPRHPFLDPTTEAYNLVDSMSAVRKLVPDTSDRWFALGIGQGGQAAWAADELVENHGMGLKLAGAVSVAPIADIEGLADRAAAGELTADQKLLLVSYLAGLKNTYGNDVNLDDYRGGAATEKWDALLACDVKSTAELVRLANQISADDLRPKSHDALERLRGYLHKIALPQGPTSAPMLVIFGGQDPMIPREWTDRALERACGMGDVIQIQFLPDRGGPDVDLSGPLRWMSDRLNGAPSHNDCADLTMSTGPSPGGG